MSADHLNPETVGALIDNELSAFDEAVARRHLTDCHACSLKVISATQLKSATARVLNRFAPSVPTLDRLKLSIQPPPKPLARVLSFRSLVWATAAALVLFTVSLLGWHEYKQSSELTTELVDQHLTVLSDSSTPQVISSDRHTVKPWFQGKLPFSFNLPEPNALPPDTTLQGADLAYLDGRATAMLLFTIRKHRVSVFVSQRQLTPELQRHTARSGFNLVEGERSDLDFVAVSDTSASDLDSLVTVLLSAQRP